MSKKEITSSNPSNRKLRTKELIYAGAFGALYKGRIAEQGTREELLLLGGIYSRMEAANA